MANDRDAVLALFVFGVGILAMVAMLLLWTEPTPDPCAPAAAVASPPGAP
jgi:hypothetical protein